MKKVLLFAILACMFVSCSSDGSREIQIDEITYTPDHETTKPNEIEKVSSIFEVVPGKYELAWKNVQDVLDLHNYKVSLKLKLRLKRTVKFSEKFLNERSKEEECFRTFDFYLVDADGKEDNDNDVSPFKFGQDYNWTNGEISLYDKDQYMDFISFLQSKPGTEKEFELKTFGTISSDDGVVFLLLSYCR